LNKINTRLEDKDKVYVPVNNARLMLDVEFLLTKPVKIMHPLDYILLPYIHLTGQVWNTHATGGSGIYTWFAEDPEVIQVEGTVQIKSLKLGKTHLVVQDHKNPHN